MSEMEFCYILIKKMDLQLTERTFWVKAGLEWCIQVIFLYFCSKFTGKNNAKKKEKKRIKEITSCKIVILDLLLFAKKLSL